MMRAARIATVAAAIASASCVPWTVRPIDEGNVAATATTTPAAFVDGIWTTKLLPALATSAVDARVLLDALAASKADALKRYARCEAGGACYAAVKGAGVVTAVNTQSRVGLALVDIAPFDKQPDLSIQIGPVLRGTSLRDATGLIRFTDFVNQLQFADAGNELNDRVLKTVLAPIAKDSLKGKTITFTGTLALQDGAEPPLRELVPISLTVQEAQ